MNMNMDKDKDRALCDLEGSNQWPAQNLSDKKPLKRKDKIFLPAIDRHNNNNQKRHTTHRDSEHRKTESFVTQYSTVNPDNPLGPSLSFFPSFRPDKNALP